MIETAGPDPTTPLEQIRLTVGVIVGTHGVRGELRMRLTTDDPDSLSDIRQVYVGDEPSPRRLAGVRFHGGLALIRLNGVTTPEAGAELRGLPVRIAGTDAQPLAPGEYRLYQLIGLDAVDETGTRLGRVTDLMETGAHDVFVVTPDSGPDILLPNHPDVILDISPEQGRMVVRPLVYEG